MYDWTLLEVCNLSSRFYTEPCPETCTQQPFVTGDVAKRIGGGDSTVLSLGWTGDSRRLAAGVPQGRRVFLFHRGALFLLDLVFNSTMRHHTAFPGESTIGRTRFHPAHVQTNEKRQIWGINLSGVICTFLTVSV